MVWETPEKKLISRDILEEFYMGIKLLSLKDGSEIKEKINNCVSYFNDNIATEKKEDLNEVKKTTYALMKSCQDSDPIKSQKYYNLYQKLKSGEIKDYDQYSKIVDEIIKDTNNKVQEKNYGRVDAERQTTDRNKLVDRNELGGIQFKFEFLRHITAETIKNSFLECVRLFESRIMQIKIENLNNWKKVLFLASEKQKDKNIELYNKYRNVYSKIKSGEIVNEKQIAELLNKKPIKDIIRNAKEKSSNLADQDRTVVRSKKRG